LAWSGPQGEVTLAGAVHVHTERSHDSALQVPDIVAAARTWGLAFVVITDHDGPPAPGEEARYDGPTLVIRAAEWSTDDGHLVDLAQGAGKGPFFKLKEAVASCRSRGGPCIAAHPSSWRRQYLGSFLGVDGLEVHSAMAA